MNPHPLPSDICRCAAVECPMMDNCKRSLNWTARQNIADSASFCQPVPVSVFEWREGGCDSFLPVND
jgi:hypothetical protein